jgi:hypothetical protein
MITTSSDPPDGTVVAVPAVVVVAAPALVDVDATVVATVVAAVVGVPESSPQAAAIRESAATSTSAWTPFIECLLESVVPETLRIDTAAR